MNVTSPDKRFKWGSGHPLCEEEIPTDFPLKAPDMTLSICRETKRGMAMLMLACFAIALAP